MKVRCVNDSGWVQTNRTFLFFNLKDKEVKGPSEGDVVTVLSDGWCEGEKFYKLLEWPVGDDETGWCATCFVPLEEKFEKVKLEEIKETASVN